MYVSVRVLVFSFFLNCGFVCGVMVGVCVRIMFVNWPSHLIQQSILRILASALFLQPPLLLLLSLFLQPLLLLLLLL